ncbi:MAG TPA: response regulator [Methylocystis sp.]|nr:response regulator [Methylocystis sp.]
MKRVLVVDDSAVTRKVARRILESFHLRTSEAEHGKDALEKCEELMPDAVLLDWNMPVMDGYGFLSELRKMPGGAEPKVVFCATENEVGHIARAKHAGADEYMMKPFNTAILRAKMEDIGLV